MSQNGTTKARTDRASIRINAPVAAVWAAFAAPDAWEQGLPPEGMSGDVTRFDLRDGGGYQMTLTYGPGTAGAPGKSSERNGCNTSPIWRVTSSMSAIPSTPSSFPLA